jgi:amino acid transporter
VNVGQAIKRMLLGRPLASEDAGHQLLPKILALPVFASDALSSNAYATEEIMHVLVLAGTMSLSRSIPISLAVAALMAIVVGSYRQTVRAYPRGGGSYIVTRENLGTTPGLVAASALLTDYVLTVAVSIAAGAFAVASLAPSLLGHRVALSLGFIALVTVLNLRGVKESGTLFSIPTYGFIFSVIVMIVVGIVRCAGGSCPQAETAGQVATAVQPLTLLLVLRAFSSGSTALTGVEAIADGVSAFRGRRPADQARNAATTLGMLAVVSITMFVGITYLANRMHVHPAEHRSVVAQIAHATFGGGPGFAVVQIMTALILVLAANTAYQDFPRLSSILAKDRFMPRQFINRGDRLVFSNGVLVLAVLASLLIVVYAAEVTRLIQLYVVGVFTSFTLSQTGMVLRWRRLREPAGWQRRAAMNAIGGLTTGVVLIVVASTKFTRGAWIVIVAVPLIVLGLKAINRHYLSIGRQLRLPEGRPSMQAQTRAIVLVPRLDEATLRAIGYARAVRPLEVRAVHFGDGSAADTLRADWEERRVGVPLEIVPTGDPVAGARSYVRRLERAENEFVTVVIPEVLGKKGIGQYLRRASRQSLLLKAGLLFEPRVVVTNVPAPPGGSAGPPGRGAIAPTRVTAVVLVSAVHNATLRALAYATSLSPTDIRAVTFNVDSEETERMMKEWGRSGVDVPLEVLDSPYREVTGPLIRYARRLRTLHPDTIVSVVLPEFVVRKWWHQFLHNQTALAIKARLLFEPGVVVTSVPFHLT